MSLAESAVLLSLHAVRMSFLILRHVVIALLALRACQCNFCAHDFHLHLYYRSSHFCPGTNFEHKKKTLGSSIRPYILSCHIHSVNIYENILLFFSELLLNFQNHGLKRFQNHGSLFPDQWASVVQQYPDLLSFQFR